MHKVTIEEYVGKMRKFCGSDYGELVRNQFADNDGDSELAMLVAPSRQELSEFEKAVAIMTPDEKQHASELTDEQVAKISQDAQVDPGNMAIFFNGYTLHCKRVSQHHD
jgi:hypothetical protein